MDWLDDLAKIAKSHRIKLHMDGARLFNAAVYQKIPAFTIVKDFDSVCFCLSKSLGCPVGSVLVGNAEFIAKYKLHFFVFIINYIIYYYNYLGREDYVKP